MSRFRLYPSIRMMLLCSTVTLLLLQANSHVSLRSAKAATVNQAPYIGGYPKNIQPFGHTLALDTNPVQYNGGPVMHTSTVYVIIWNPPVLQDNNPTYFDPNYQGLIMRYFQDVGGSTLYNNLTQYYDNVHGHILNSSSFGGSWVDTSTAYPSPSDCTDSATPNDCAADIDIQTEVIIALKANKSWRYGPTDLFFVYTSRDEGTCYISSECAYTYLCGYHSSFSGQNGPIIYAQIPYPSNLNPNQPNCNYTPTSPNDPDADNAINATSHEHMEAVTDPEPNVSAAWYNQGSSQPEIGDKCVGNFGPSPLPYDNHTANVQWHGHYYILQEEWSNHHRVSNPSGCVLMETSPLLNGTVYVSALGITWYNTSDGSVRNILSPNGCSLEAPPVLVDQLMYYVSCNQLCTINVTTMQSSGCFTTSGSQVSYAPAVANGILYITSYDLNGPAFLDAFNLSNKSKPIWTYQAPSEAIFYPSPTVTNSEVYIGYTYSLYAFNATNGTLLWTYQFPGTATQLSSSVAVANGVLYYGLYGIFSGISTDYVYALQESNLTSVWNFQTPGPVNNTPTLGNGTVYFGVTSSNAAGYIYALNTGNGTPIWSYFTDKYANSQAVVVGSMLYFGGDGIYALNATNGTLIWNKQSGNYFVTPFVSKGVVFDCSVESPLNIYELQQSNGSTIWSAGGGGNGIVASFAGY